jgi:predicted site-specific integrase-resolvase
MITTEQAAVMAGTGTRTIYRWIEAGAVHFSEISNGNLIVCAKSLAAASESHRR